MKSGFRCVAILGVGLSLVLGLPLAAWENSLGMRFVSVPGVAVQFCIWETRVKDFACFVQATRPATTNGIYQAGAERAEFCPDCSWAKPGFEQGPDHPVVGVNWDDAQAFCRWLTETERQSGRLQSNQHYRLPTDLEWSCAAGLPKEAGLTPQARFLQIKDVYPIPWPAPTNSGNFADALGVDAFRQTAPVGSFPPNLFGLHDLAGNVSEWCADWWNLDQKFRVLRGSSWNLDCSLCLMSSYRYPNFPSMRNDTYGFRVVLE